MDAVEFLKEQKRMCESADTCSRCQLDGKCKIPEINFNKIKDTVSIVEEWSKEHPIKTNLKFIVDDFIKEKFGEDFNGYCTDEDALILYFKNPDFFDEVYNGEKQEQKELNFVEFTELQEKMCTRTPTCSCGIYKQTHDCLICDRWVFEHPKEAQEILLKWKKEQEDSQFDF